ncbi:CopD family copper resistance protein [Pseudomonas leptonychotis]|uniref:CopD family copper resistance protein n=1 Tax=Pseudomonas leptonychotis TaxID=2448482 RepID=UPI0039F0BBD9
MWYALFHVLHLLAAIAFVGVVFFQLVILANVKNQLDSAALPALEYALSVRIRAVLHWVVVLLYGAGFVLAWHYRQVLSAPISSSFSTLLTLKIALAVTVFASYGALAMLLRSGRMTAELYRKLHWAVLAQMLAIVLLAKAMFHLNW